jgi:tartrate-resistant acid phosphatase type 5
MIRRGVAALGLFLALGCGRQRDLCIAVIGDFGGDTPAEAKVAALVTGFQPDLVVTVGDNNYPDGAAETIERNIGKHYGALIREKRFFPALGNHDWRTAGAKPYLDYFELPGNERYYDLVRGDVHLFFVDSDPHEPDGVTRDSVQARWLRDGLSRSQARHKWVLFHHPPYSSGPHGSIDELQWPFRAWGATAVFSGHDHDYERFDLGGMPYVVVGTGGQTLYKMRDPIGGSVKQLERRHGALRIDVRKGEANAEFVSVTDDARDRFALPAPLPDPETLVSATDRWHILDGVAPGAGWLLPSFDQTQWALASTPLRIVDRGAASGAHARVTCYRIEFEIAGTARLLELGLPRDQPAVAYLNGKEVARVVRNPPREQRWLVPRGPRPEANAEPILTHQLLDGALLASGTNVLAVAVEHVPDDGGDPSFAAELIAYATRPATPP